MIQITVTMPIFIKGLKRKRMSISTRYNPGTFNDLGVDDLGSQVKNIFPQKWAEN